MNVSYIIISACWLTLWASAAFSQTQIPFTFTARQGSSSAVIAPNSTITISSPAVGQDTSVTITATYNGSTRASVSRIVLSGSTQLTLDSPQLPVLLATGESISFTIHHLPTSTNQAAGQLGFTFAEGSGAATTASFNIIGATSDFVIAYVAPGTGNVVAVQNGDTIALPPTLANSTVTIPVSIMNRGTGPGVIQNVAISGAAFQALGLPLFPLVLDTGRELRFSIRYQPTQIQTDTGALTVSINNNPITIGLSATATGSMFSYELLDGETVVPFLANGTVPFPDTPIGDVRSVSIRVRNVGNADGQISSISIIGVGFQVADLPILPLTLAPNSGFIFTLTFSPTQPGRVTGRLRIGSDFFNVAATAIGPALRYSFSNGSALTTLGAGGTVVFTPAAVGSTSQVDFIIQNNGTTAASISSIGTTPRSLFQVQNLPQFPVSIDPQTSLHLPVRFAPNNVGVLTDVLRIDNQAFTLSGTGLQPAALPDYDIGGTSATVQPLQQPAISLTLAQPYTLDVDGTLRIGFNTESFAADPSIQFATGGTTVNFTIPAGSRNAVFANNSTAIRLQSGTVAGQLTLTPTFTTGANLDITPTNPKIATMTIAAAAPVLLTVEAGSKTTNAFSLMITGFATDRSLKDMEITFTPSNSGTLRSTTLRISLDSSASLWFRSTASQNFGGLFSITIPLALSGPAPSAGSSMVDVIDSVSVTVANDRGRSNSLSVQVR